MSATTFIISGNDQEQMEPPVDSSDVDDESLNGKTIDFEPSPTKPDDNALKKFFFTLWIPTYYHLVGFPHGWGTLWRRHLYISVRFRILMALLFMIFITCKLMIAGLPLMPFLGANIYYTVTYPLKMAAIGQKITLVLFWGSIRNGVFDIVFMERSQECSQIVMSFRKERMEMKFTKKVWLFIKGAPKKLFLALISAAFTFLLGLIPVVGFSISLAWDMLQTSLHVHSRYVTLVGRKNNEFFMERKYQYLCYGIVSSLMKNLIPFVGLLLDITSAAGAGKWASNLHMTKTSFKKD